MIGESPEESSTFGVITLVLRVANGGDRFLAGRRCRRCSRYWPRWALGVGAAQK